MERLTEKNPKWFTEILYVDACKPSESDIENLYRKLKRYEDLEEQGRLLELPCKVGQIVYELNYTNKCDACKDNKIGKCRYDGSDIECPSDIWKVRETSFSCISQIVKHMKEFGKVIFLTEQEANEKLRKMKGEK